MIDTEDAVMGSSPSSPVPSDSPVTWHVIIWVILCLAINSMAQPSSKICGLSSLCRIYLATSPIIIFADAMSAFVRIPITSIFLRISPKKASQLVVMSRLENEFNGINNQSQEGPGRTWPRWLFFVMGPLPAAIKLASFSGIPWTKTWGMMFAASFVIVELISLPSRTGSHGVSTPGLLDPTVMHNSDQELHSKFDSLTQNLDVLDKTLFSLAFLAHLCLLTWAVEVLWLKGVDKAVELGLAGFLIELVRAIVLTLLVISTFLSFILGLAWLGLWCVGWLPQQERSKRLLATLLKAGALILVVSAFLPDGKSVQEVENTKPAIPPPPSWLRQGKTMAISWYFLAAIYSVFFLLLVRICRRWPIVSRALLIECRDKDHSGGRQQDESPGDVKAWPFDPLLWVLLCFFLTNLAVCVLWYAFMYDSTDTINPSWTDVFGK
ncbi:hypothetical protein IFR05_010349 [Cadophora sp. M221]|nr:hypothetical protein IFR05_010349 [Cadophora sp. M221]